MRKRLMVISIIVMFTIGLLSGILVEPVFAPTYQIPPNISYPQYYSQYSNVNNFDGYTGKQLEKAFKGTKNNGAFTIQNFGMNF